MFQKIANAISILSFLLHVVYIGSAIIGYRMITAEGFIDELIGIPSFSTDEIKPDKTKDLFPEFK